MEEQSMRVASNVSAATLCDTLARAVTQRLEASWARRQVSAREAVPLTRYVTEEVAARATGYSVRAIREKRVKGVWLEGRVWAKAPDGRVLIDLDGYERWVRHRT